MSTIALHSTLNNISETVRELIEAWFQITTDMKWPMENQMVS